MPIKVGRFRQKALGIFQPKPRVIRTRLANDVEVSTHEAGHAIQQLLGGGDMQRGEQVLNFQGFGEELYPLAEGQKGPKGAEGFAEFLRGYVTNQLAIHKAAPKFYAHFDDVMKRYAPEVLEVLENARTNFTRYLLQGPEARILSQISVDEREPARWPSLSSLYARALDQMHPLKRFAEDVLERAAKNGKPITLSPSHDPYLLARVFTGWAGKAETFLRHGTLDADMKVMGKSLKDILGPIDRADNLESFRAYAVARRALELSERKIETGIDPKDAKWEVENRELPGFREAFDDLQTYNNSLLQYLVDAGVISAEQKADIQKMNQAYVPFYRVLDEESTKRLQTGTGMTFADLFSPVKRIKGSARVILDPLESIVKNTYAMVNVADRNAVGLAIADLANLEGAGKYIRRIPTPMRGTAYNVADIQRELENAGVDVPEEAVENMLTIFRPESFHPSENVITVLREGKREYYEVEPDLYRAVKGLDREQANVFIKLLRKPAALLRAAATLTPEFMARNPIRDQATAAIFSKYGYRPIIDLVNGLSHLFKQDDVYWAWRSSGGAYSMLVSMDRKYLQQNLQDLMKTRMEKLKNVVRHPIDFLRMLSEFSESGTRLGEFHRGLKKEGATKDGKLLSAYASREVTLDFSRRGANMSSLNQVVAFFNANLQGYDKLFRAFREDPVKTSWKAIALLTVPSILLLLHNRRDKRWKEIPDWQKDLFWIQFTEKDIWRIPKPFEIGILFASLPERVVEHILDHSPQKVGARKVRNALLRGGSPGIIPTAALPVIENWANKSTFLDRPLIPYGRERLRPDLQYGDYTTETAKLIGRMLNQSPALLENTIRGYTGGMGRYALNASDLVLRKTGIVEAPPKPAIDFSEWPGFRAFAVRYPTASSQSVNDFYDYYDVEERAFASAKELRRDGKDEEADSIARDTGDLMGLRASLLKTHRDLSDLRKQAREINRDPDLTPEQKRVRLDALYLRMSARARDIVKRIEHPSAPPAPESRTVIPERKVVRR
ncbi:MAG: hypothetical protein KKA68_21190 [Gammaproteobacteria bacterium]|nr:hypothetical protein [Gammaproteobacteria bacterium]